jgi:hypothetical protein
MAALENPDQLFQKFKKYNSCILFTDPSVLCVTATGDVDDIAAILLLAQIYREQLTVVICDDDGRRYGPFMDKYGNDIVRLYGCNIIRESDLATKFPGGLHEDTCAFIHAPVSGDTADWLDFNQASITDIFAQGESPYRANFVSAPRMWDVLNASFSRKTTLYASDSTGFFIPYDPAYLAKLHPKAQQLYLDYNFFQKLKAFGLPADNVTLADQLFSNTGGPGGRPGNGIFFRLKLIADLRGTGYMPPQNSPELIAELGEIDTALQNSYRRKGRGTNESTVANLRDLLWLTNKYCDYSRFLIRNPGGVLLPDMGNIPVPINPTPDLPVYQPRDGVREEVRLMFDPALTKTTNLFDFSSAGYAMCDITPPTNSHLPGNPPSPGTVSELRTLLLLSLDHFSEKLIKPAAAAMVNGGRRKSRRKRSKRRRTRR